MSPENLDNLAAEMDRSGAHHSAAALRAASTGWRRTLNELADRERENTLLQGRINRAHAAPTAPQQPRNPPRNDEE